MGQASSSTDPQVLLAPGFYTKDILPCQRGANPLAGVRAILLSPGHFSSLSPPSYQPG